jgi:Coenzyme PQQ synthesis protein D (PqqD)
VRVNPRRAPDAALRRIRGVPHVSRAGSAEVLYELSDVAAVIWRLADGARSVDEIARLVAEDYNVEPDEAARDTHAFIQELVALGLMETPPDR